MIILSDTTDTIKAVLTAAKTANDMFCVVSYRDIDASTYTPGRTVSTTNGLTATTLQAAPTSSHRLVVDLISIFNADTATKTLTITFDVSGTGFVVWYGSLRSGESVRYQDGCGWEKSDAAGNFTQPTSTPAYAPTIVDVQIFTTPGAGTWTKPTLFTPTFICAVLVGAGGGGGGGASLAYNSAVARFGGAGGGGGAYARRLMLSSDLGTSEAVSVGTGGTAGTAGDSGGDGGSGGVGGDSSFGTVPIAVAYGGGGGMGGDNSATIGGGGGGGGTGAAGVTGTTAAGAGGAPGASTLVACGGTGGKGDIDDVLSGYAEYGGGGGGGHDASPAGGVGPGGSSIYGGGGGGCGGSGNADPTAVDPSPGGASGTVGLKQWLPATNFPYEITMKYPGGAPGKSCNPPTIGIAGAAGNSKYSGAGGGGGGSVMNENVAGATGGAGGACGGGGGGGGSGCNTQTGGTGGVGGRGEVRVYSW